MTLVTTMGPALNHAPSAMLSMSQELGQHIEPTRLRAGPSKNPEVSSIPVVPIAILVSVIVAGATVLLVAAAVVAGRILVAIEDGEFTSSASVGSGALRTTMPPLVDVGVI